MALPFHVEQPIAASPAEVWSFLREIDHADRWMRDTQSIEVLTPGALAVGSRFRQTRKMYGRVATEEFTVTTLDPTERRIALEVDGRKGSAGRGVFRFRYEVQPRGATSVVVLDGEIAELGRAVEFVAGFFVGNFVGVVKKDLEGLRDCIEAG